jgi:hypothetical protein
VGAASDIISMFTLDLDEVLALASQFLLAALIAARCGQVQSAPCRNAGNRSRYQ